MKVNRKRRELAIAQATICTPNKILLHNDLPEHLQSQIDHRHIRYLRILQAFLLQPSQQGILRCGRRWMWILRSRERGKK